jgi:amino acid adenylation domain-containing protein
VNVNRLEREAKVNGIALNEKRQVLLERMLQAKGVSQSVRRPIPRRNPDLPVPLSFSQERLWFLDQLAMGSQFYVENSAIRLLFEIRPDLLERAINMVVSRHDVLRAHIEMHEGQPVQVAAPSLHVPLPVADLSPLDSAARDQEVERLALEHAMQPFDLGKAPLLRTRLVKLGYANYVFLLTIHHIVSDGWSMGIFSREVSEYYTAAAAGRLVQPPPLPIQYFDYAVWQRDELRGESLDKQISYWREQLRDVPQIELPLDHPRPSALSYAGSHLDVRLAANLSASLRALSRREHTTLFMTALAVFAGVLNFHTGQTDLAVATPVAGRNRAELEPLIGVFLNTLVLRLDLSGDPSFSELLQRVKRVTLAAFEHQDVQFGRLVEELQPDRDLGKNPLVQVLFQFFTPPNEKAGASSLTPETVAVDRGTAILDLAWHLWDGPEGMRGHIEYSTELFERETVERQFQHFIGLLSQVVAHPDRPLSELQIITSEEREKLLGDYQGATCSWPAETSISKLFEAQVAQSPGSVAIVEGVQRVTRRELSKRANRIAHHLLEIGVRRNDRVAICLDRSADATAAALAVLRVGAAYVPLDPAYPAARLSFILSDSRARVLISNRMHADRVSTGEARLVVLDAETEAIARQSAATPTVNPDPLDSAYIIYTSGSTGRPKGVVGLHGGIMNRFQWMWKEFPFTPGEVACQRTALSFVDSVWEMFGPLLAGVPLIVVPEETGRDANALVKLLAEHAVTRLLTVPSLLLAMLESGSVSMASLPKLRLWFTSGERLTDDVVRRFRNALPDRELVNLYGSSEVAGDILCESVRLNAVADHAPIGRPIANSRAYILDATYRLVPERAVGELFVAGPNLARGYLDQPALTAERFLPDPFCAEPGARMYATGDRARYLPDGRIEFLGRTDHQVKLRGFRIELGEVEAALREHPGILDAAVAVHDDGAGGRLVAYVVPIDPSPDVEDLRRFVGSRLPDHMVPGSVVWLDALPLTPNGKLDRTTLPQVQNISTSAHFVAPQTESEEALASIWAELLGIDKVGVLDNFFDLGGHSLLAIRLVSRLRDDLGVELPLRQIFLNPTVAKLAMVVEARLLDEIETLTNEEARQLVEAELA